MVPTLHPSYVLGCGKCCCQIIAWLDECYVLILLAFLEVWIRFSVHVVGKRAESFLHVFGRSTVSYARNTSANSVNQHVALVGVGVTH